MNKLFPIVAAFGLTVSILGVAAAMHGHLLYNRAMTTAVYVDHWNWDAFVAFGALALANAVALRRVR